jgi:hypothetical protein
MNGESGGASASVAIGWPANQLELVWLSSQLPALVARKLAHICELSFEVLHHGTFVRARQKGVNLAGGCSPPPTFG